MPRYQIEAANPETGMTKVMLIGARDEVDARQTAERLGYRIDTVKLLPRSSPPDGTEAYETQEPSQRTIGAPPPPRPVPLNQKIVGCLLCLLSVMVITYAMLPQERQVLPLNVLESLAALGFATLSLAGGVALLLRRRLRRMLNV